ncbi:lipase secretion chaperone [Microbulbifer mangrovi]|uniref:lipase secretion chaperone n=1 Tax=Microbulbifer mangrovi TaxID=927787 RepID=UPI00099039C5|nr:lipase secretion chaperone [Microbulbifer mangrovi]
MKIFITCAVIALLVSGVLAKLWFSPEPRDKTAASLTINEPVEINSPGDGVAVAYDPENEIGIAEKDSGKPVEGLSESEYAAAGKSGRDSLDTVALYDALLILNFDSEGNLLFDRNTRTALQLLHDQLEEDGDGADSRWQGRLESLQALLSDALPEAVAMQLLDLLQDFSAYRQAVEDVQRTRATDTSAASNPLDNYEQIKALRRSYLEEEQASGMYAEEEAQLPYMVESMAVARDPNLSEEERAEKLAAMQAEFNETASRMDSPLARKVLEAKVARMRADGASDAEVFAARDAVLGSAEAARLADEELGIGDQGIQEQTGSETGPGGKPVSIKIAINP